MKVNGSDSCIKKQNKLKERGSLDLKRDDEGRILANRRRRFFDPGYFVWCGSPVKWCGDWWLFYSRWPVKYGFDAWVTHSEIAAVKLDDLGGNPVGPSQKLLPMKKGPAWARDVAHNPTVSVASGNLFMALMATQGPELSGSGDMKSPSMDDPVWWEYRNNQRIAIVSSKHPLGPWSLPESPSFDVDRNGWDNRLVSNPSFCARPEGGWLLVYKAVEGDESTWGREVRHGIAHAATMTGPWHRVPGVRPFSCAGSDFPAEDPFIWYDRKAQVYRAIVKDMKGVFTGVSPSLAHFISHNGYDWDLDDPKLLMGNCIRWEDGTIEMMERVERPQVAFDIDGSPVALQVAVLPRGKSALSYSLCLPCHR